MAKRKRYSAVHHHADMMPRRGYRKIKVEGGIERNVGAANARAYMSEMCIARGQKLGVKTCASAAGKSPTSAVAKALRVLAQRVSKRR